MVCTQSPTNAFVVRLDDCVLVSFRTGVVSHFSKHLEEEDMKDEILHSLSEKRGKVNPC